MANKIVGSVLATSAPTDMMVVSRSGQFREMLVSSIGIDHAALTSTVSGLRTYTLYRSADTSSVFGTIQVQDGTDGAGMDIPDYTSGFVYKKNNTVLDDDGYAYRFINSTPTQNQKPQNNTVINGTYWQRLFIGQDDQFQKLDSATSAVNAMKYLVDTTGGSFTLDVPAAVTYMSIADYNKTWSNTNKLTVSIGADSFEFNHLQSRFTYEFRRLGSQFRVSGSDGSVIWGNV